ncbi:hypothetical protein SAMN05421835_11788 [Amycolatopsis sacchari]|uniref:Uncharacterized protein n=1 Tax=Amycolatopsis sacchari TaxID=115433 RepID=A0A1I3YBA7_9PSEU|nr:hypothetical protein [Amycolatopsis sacchari]SFK29138.1 hypothetical protein SAMN05421835_11788 [Amycolatopsis sacchari]
MSYPNQPPQWNPYGQQPGQYPQQPPTGQYPQQPGPYGQQQYGYGQPGPYGQPGQWGQPPALSRPNIWAGAVLVLGGLFGVLQFFLPWIDSSFSNVHATGMDVADLASAASAFGAGSSATLIEIGVWAVLIGGALEILLGATMFVPMRNHRPIGVVTLVLSVFMVVGAVFWLTGGDPNPDSTSLGYYFFLIAGVVSLIGGVLGVVRR